MNNFVTFETNPILCSSYSSLAAAGIATLITAPPCPPHAAAIRIAHELVMHLSTPSGWDVTRSLPISGLPTRILFAGVV